MLQSATNLRQKGLDTQQMRDLEEAEHNFERLYKDLEASIDQRLAIQDGFHRVIESLGVVSEELDSLEKQQGDEDRVKDLPLDLRSEIEDLETKFTKSLELWEPLHPTLVSDAENVLVQRFMVRQTTIFFIILEISSGQDVR